MSTAVDPKIAIKASELRDRFRRALAREQLDHLYKHPWSAEKPVGPYGWQVEFHQAGADYTERGILGANRTGKTKCGSSETSFHLTGAYPDWWTGLRFDHPTDIWVGSETNESSRDITQLALLGGLGNDLGTGTIQGRYLEGNKPSMRQCGVQDVVDKIQVNHVSGGKSLLAFKTYDQKRERWQGTSKDFIWLDEEPPETIYAEAQTRTLDKKGSMIMTFTPLKGIGAVVHKFLNFHDFPGVWMINATWDDSPHLDPVAMAQMLASLPEHERDARSKGIPTMGQGVVFPFKDEDISVPAFEIPKHYRQICAIDFGINHPAAAVWLAWDIDADIIYVTDCYKQAQEGAAYHANRIRQNRGSSWIPVAWPHDGMNREKSGGSTLAEHYRRAGVNMMQLSARDDDLKGGSQAVEPTVLEMYDRMRTGRFKVFSHLDEWFAEKRLYHRDENLKVVDIRDDILSATRYGVMMRRFAISQVQSDMVTGRGLTGSNGSDYDPTGDYD